MPGVPGKPPQCFIIGLVSNVLAVQTFWQMTTNQKVNEDDMSNVVALRAKKTSTSTTVNRKVAKTRDYLTPDEVDN
jgi:hypothetical protein